MKYISILTTQNVTIRYELASARDRTFATIIDWGAMLLVWLILWAGATLVFDRALVYVEQLLKVLLVFYHLISELALNGRSLGKRALGIKVVKINGTIPSWMDYILRWAFRLIDISLSLGGVAVMSSSSSENGQRLGDLFAGTTVIRLNSSYIVSNENLQKVAEQKREEYQATYPEVVQLTDTDMLTVKAVLSRQQKYHPKTYQSLLQKTATKISQTLGVTPQEPESRAFLECLLKDYIRLTR